ncbi:hypothetical protein HU200_006327 [Digitaria exilis]|uniref:Uncharacterized protein n=1 Tax=Digitaria exilis TaxID=1010633 RepID=A0A835FSI3_9POAL|nr:hypothetical protein HU200_006327 [Digitaria exilis]
MGLQVPSRRACAPASSPARKRKPADAIDVERPEASTRARKRQTAEEDDDAMTSTQSLESEVICYFEAENLKGGELAAAECHDSHQSAAMAPCSAQPEEEEEATVVTIQPSRRGSVAAANDDEQDVREISLEVFLAETLTAISKPKRSSTPTSVLTDDDQDDGMCGLACPPMDDDYVGLILSEPLGLVQFRPAFLKEFISDLI